MAASHTLAAVFASFGTPSSVLRVKRIPLPAITPKSVRLKFLASPINPADVNQIQGVYPLKPTFHDGIGAIGGNEGVAEVLEIGDNVRSLKAGDWVVPKTNGFGTWRVLANAEEGDVIKVDSRGASAVSVGSVSVNPCTAYRMLKDFVKLSSGDIIIQNGANSAVGQAVIQLAHAWGLKTVNVVRDRPDLASLENELKDLGADVIVTEDSSRQWAGKIKSLNSGAPKLALNCVGGKSATNLARNLSHGAPLITYGGMSKEPLPLPASLLIFNDLQFRGFWMSRWYSHCSEEERATMTRDILDLSVAGKFKEPWHTTISWGNGGEEEVGPRIVGAVDAALGGKVKKQILVP
ncbi:mitochondrial 2-enoyl thioester reductase [Irineochytrium annulatum]|nr:mitochondrial 2-enoyl thioester reductase [Irineochytrium annulatum]